MMAQFNIKQTAPVKPGEIPIIDAIDGDNLLVKPSGIIFKTDGDISGIFKEATADTLGVLSDVSIRNADRLILTGDRAGAIIQIEAGSPAAWTITELNPVLPSGATHLAIVENATDADRTIAISDPLVAYRVPGGKTTLELSAGAIGIIQFFK